MCRFCGEKNAKNGQLLAYLPMGPDPVGKKPFLWPLKKKSFQKITHISLKSPRMATKPFLIVRYMFLDDIHIFFFFLTTFDFCDFDHWKNVKLEKTMPVLWPEVEFSAVFFIFRPLSQIFTSSYFFLWKFIQFLAPPPKKFSSIGHEFSYFQTTKNWKFGIDFG